MLCLPRAQLPHSHTPHLFHPPTMQRPTDPQPEGRKGKNLRKQAHPVSQWRSASDIGVSLQHSGLPLVGGSESMPQRRSPTKASSEKAVGRTVLYGCHRAVSSFVSLPSEGSSQSWLNTRLCMIKDHTPEAGRHPPPSTVLSSITFYVRSFLGTIPTTKSHSSLPSLHPADSSLSPFPTLWESEGPVRRRHLLHSPRSRPILFWRTHMASSLVSAHKCRREPSRRFTVSRPSRLRPSGGCTSRGRHMYGVSTKHRSQVPQQTRNKNRN